MSIFTLSENDPIVVRAKALEDAGLTEVGFIPDDEYGCKIYGRNEYGRTILIGIHSKSYGCPKTSTDTVQIMPALLRR